MLVLDKQKKELKVLEVQLGLLRWNLDEAKAKVEWRAQAAAEQQQQEQEQEQSSP